MLTLYRLYLGTDGTKVLGTMNQSEIYLILNLFVCVGIYIRLFIHTYGDTRTCVDDLHYYGDVLQQIKATGVIRDDSVGS